MKSDRSGAEETQQPGGQPAETQKRKTESPAAGMAETSDSGEFIAQDSPHWKVEPFIPIPCSELVALLERLGNASPTDASPTDAPAGAADAGTGSAGVQLRQTLPAAQATETLGPLAARIARRLHADQLADLEALEACYLPLDPDRDTSLLQQRTDADRDAAATEVVRRIRRLLQQADYTELQQEEIQRAIGAASDWGVTLRIDLSIFRHLAVYARGDVMGMRVRRRWQRLYRKELVEVPIYRRLVVVFQVQEGMQIDGEVASDALHLRMFKNIPKLDVDMLLPGSRVQMSWLDRTRIVVPSLSGIGFTLWRLARLALVIAALSVLSAVKIAALLAVAVGYALRSVFNYLNTRKRYELSLTRSLYFQKLDSNAGVIYRLLEEARQQSLREALIAYHLLATANAPLSRDDLQRRAERLVEEATDVVVRFEVDDALEVLDRFQLISESGIGNRESGVRNPESGTLRGTSADRA